MEIKAFGIFVTKLIVLSDKRRNPEDKNEENQSTNKTPTTCNAHNVPLGGSVATILSLIYTLTLFTMQEGGKL